MTIARVQDGAVLEMRPTDMDDVPEHKRSLWLPVVYEGEGAAEVVTVEAARVLVTRSAGAPFVPNVISDRQFFQQLAHLGVISDAEALAAVGPGEIPSAMSTMIDALPTGDQFAARMLLTGATQFERRHPLVSVFAAAFGWTADDIDAFWIAAHAL